MMIRFAPLWVIDFPLFEWDEATKRLYAKHHPFTSPKIEDMPFLDTNPLSVSANAYDLVINGVEIGGGSVRIHDKDLQKKMFESSDLPMRRQMNSLDFLWKHSVTGHRRMQGWLLALTGGLLYLPVQNL
jgi:aspartyl-tRNA synthetase